MKTRIAGLLLGLFVANAEASWEHYYSYDAWQHQQVAAAASIVFWEHGLRDGTLLADQLDAFGLQFRDRNDYVMDDASVRRHGVDFFSDGRGMHSRGQIRIDLAYPVEAVAVRCPMSCKLIVYGERGQIPLHETPDVGRRESELAEQMIGSGSWTHVPHEEVFLGVSGGSEPISYLVIDNIDGDTYVDELLLVYAEPEGMTLDACYTRASDGKRMKGKTVKYVYAEGKQDERRFSRTTDRYGCITVEGIEQRVWSTMKLRGNRTQKLNARLCWSDGYTALSAAPVEHIRNGRNVRRWNGYTDLAGCVETTVKSNVWLDSRLR